MKKASVNMSKMKPLSNNKSETNKTDVVVNTSNVNNPSKIDKKFAECIRKDGKTPPKNFVTDGNVQIVDVSGKVYGYVLSKTKPAMGIIGCLTSDDKPKTWTFTKAKDGHQAGIAAAKEVKLQELFNKARTATLAECDDTVAEVINVVAVKQVDQADDGQSKELTEEQRDDTAVARLAVLSDFDYDRVRKMEAKRIGIRVNTLDKAVATERNQANDLKYIGPRLFSDVHEIVTSQDVDQISTTELISVLCADKIKIWSVYNRGNQIDPKQLAHILSLFGVSPRDIRFNNFVLKGYTRESIVAAYSRYISSTAQPPQDDSSE